MSFPHPLLFYQLLRRAVMSEEAEEDLDQIVKGAPPPTAKLPAALASRNPAPLPNMAENAPGAAAEKYTPSDPLSTLPSSPPQIYLNLLILEASLRSQYLTLRARRRLHSFFLLLLLLWNSCFTYLLFLKPREDGLGIGGSVYWIVEMMEKVALMGGILTGLLIWGTGQWERGVRWPRRWLYIANRGLRSMNTKIVIVKGKWWKEGLGHMSFLFPLDSLIGQSPGSEWHYVEHSISHAASRTSGHHHANPSPNGGAAADEEAGGPGSIVEEDLAPGGDHIKLLLLPKSFSPEFRENWEEYRADYWEKENERRSLLRQRLKNKKRTKAKQKGGWFWWSGMWRMKTPPRPTPPPPPPHTQAPPPPYSSSSRPSSHHFSENEKLAHHAHPNGPSRSATTPPSVSADSKQGRRRSQLLLRTDSTASNPAGTTAAAAAGAGHSRTSSRSSTPSLPEVDEKLERASSSSSSNTPGLPDEKAFAAAVKGSGRRGSSAGTRKGKLGGREGGGGGARPSSMVMSPLTRAENAVDGEGGEEDSRPGTPAAE